MLVKLDPQTWQLETERLIIRAPRVEDAVAVNAGVHESFAELRPWMPWAKQLPTIADTEAVSRRANEEFAAGLDLSVRLWLRDGTFVGASGLHRGNPVVPSMEIGYWCRTSLAGRGYISETVRALHDFGFGVLGLQRLEIRCGTRNAGSRRVAEKCGFQLEGVLRHFDRDNDGSLRDICIYACVPTA